MSLSRQFLSAIGLESDKIDQVIERHSEAVEALKAQRDHAKREAESLREGAEKAESLEKQIEELKAQIPTDDWKAKYDSKNKEFEEFKAQVEAERINAQKATLYRNALKNAGVADRFLDDIMNMTDLKSVEMRDGELVDVESINSRVKDKFSSFIETKRIEGTKVPEPPDSTPSDGANPEIVKQLRERHERLFGKSNTKE